MNDDFKALRTQLAHKGIALPMDDIATGQFVSVLGGVLPSSMNRPLGRCDHPIALTGRRVTPGTPLLVLKLSLPFVLCGIVGPGKTMAGPIVIDMRAFHFCRLSDDFIEAVIEFTENIPKTNIPASNNRNSL